MKFVIDTSKVYQTFEGFGASGAWWAQVVGDWNHIDDASGLPVNKRIADLLYGSKDGIGLRIYRYNLGGGSKKTEWLKALRAKTVVMIGQETKMP